MVWYLCISEKALRRGQDVQEPGEERTSSYEVEQPRDPPRLWRLRQQNAPSGWDLRGKIASGILSLSVFVCINGLYTLGMVLARYCALAGAIRTQDPGQQYGYYRRSGMILIAASLLYICYSVWSFFHPKEVSYHMYVALAIATFTFAEIGVNLYGMIANRKNRTPLLHAIKTINLAAALISLVLTQSAILSFAGGEDHDPAVNALMGMLSGTCAALLGVFMLWRIGKLRRRETNEMGDISYDPDTGGG